MAIPAAAPPLTPLDEEEVVVVGVVPPPPLLVGAVPVGAAGLKVGAPGEGLVGLTGLSV